MELQASEENLRAALAHEKELNELKTLLRIDGFTRFPHTAHHHSIQHESIAIFL